MSGVPTIASDEKAERFLERRAQLAASALRTLSELGYARTSLREIGKNSEFSHGVLHYYFRDKVDLILTGVRQYKTQCVTRYDGIVATATTADGLRTAFSQAMGQTLRDDARVHRLWYDLRSQSLFEVVLQQDVLVLDNALQDMIWRVVAAYATLSGRLPVLSAPAAYAFFDGIFQQQLLHYLAGDAGAPARLEVEAAEALDHVVPAG